MDVIGITGATGLLGGAVARALGARVGRLIVRDPSRAPAIEGDPQVAVAEYGDREAVQRAFEGVDVLLLVSGSEAPDRLEQHRTAVAAAAAAGVRHVVYTSFDGAAPDAVFTLGRDHWHTEQAIRDSGMGFTLLRDAFYAELLQHFADEHGVISGPAGDGRFAPVSRADVADVAVAVLSAPDEHAGRTYALTGPEALTFAEVAERLTGALGRTYSFQDQTLEQAYASRRPLSDQQWQLDAWVSTYTAIASGDLSGVSDDLPALLGRPARTLEQVVRSPE